MGKDTLTGYEPTHREMSSQDIRYLTHLLQRVAAKNVDGTAKSHYFEEEPQLELGELVERLKGRIRCSSTCFPLALVYLDRATNAASDLPITMRTVNRLFGISLLLANQFLDDKVELEEEFARAMRLACADVIFLKTDLLFRLRFRLFATDVEVKAYSDRLHGDFSTCAIFEESGFWDGITNKPLTRVPASPKRPNVTAACPHDEMVTKAPPSKGDIDTQKQNRWR